MNAATAPVSGVDGMVDGVVFVSFPLKLIRREKEETVASSKQHLEETKIAAGRGSYG